MMFLFIRPIAPSVQSLTAPCDLDPFEALAIELPASAPCATPAPAQPSGKESWR